jgi:hypothetical protein
MTIPFKKGYDPRRNTKGASGGKRTALCRALFQDFMTEQVEVNDPTTGKKVKMERAKLLLSKLFAMVMKGDIKAIEVFLDRTMGRVPFDQTSGDAIVMRQHIESEVQTELAQAIKAVATEDELRTVAGVLQKVKRLQLASSCPSREEDGQ